jgi:prephenate dehydrogenase
MTTTVIGVGLIGGSMAIEIRNAGMSSRILGVENNPHHAEQALALGLVDEVLGLEELPSPSSPAFWMLSPKRAR